MTQVQALPNRRLAVLAAGFLSSVACSHAQVKPDASATSDAGSPAAVSTDAQAPLTTQAFHAQGNAELDKALDDLRQVRVFFDFDAATLTPEAEQKLTNVSAILVKHLELQIRVEGNCDERGSEQYNLALGQRRADSARKYLAALGVAEGQITAISFGAEKPAAVGHREQAWKQNRRDDLTAQR